MSNKMVSFKMGSGIGALLLKAMPSLPEYQWVRELIVNSAEAGARNVWIGPWKNPDTGKTLIAVWDDGHGMTEAQMHKHLYSLFESGKGTGNNFGWGARLSSLGQNPDGIMFASRTEEGEVMVKMAIDRKTGDAGIIKWETDDGLEDMIDPFGGVLDQIGKSPTGTAVILCGDGEIDSWHDADYVEIINYIKSRFFEYPSDDLTVRVWQHNRGGAEAAGGWRLVHPAMSNSTAPEVTFGEFDIRFAGHNGKVLWTIAPESHGEDKNQHLRIVPGVGLLNSREIFGISKGYLGHFGIPYANLQNRVQILIDMSGAQMNLERTRVNVRKSGGGHYENYPMKQLGAAFIEHMPAELSELLIANVSYRQVFTENMARKLGADWAKNLNAITVPIRDKDGHLHSAGDVVGNVTPIDRTERHDGDGEGGTPPEKKRQSKSRDGGGLDSAKEKRRKMLPVVEWVKDDQVDHDMHKYGVWFEENVNTIYVSDECGPFTRTVTILQGESAMSDEMIEGAVRQVYEVELAAAVVDARGSSRWDTIARGDTDELLSDAALFMKMLGEQAIAEQARTLVVTTVDGGGVDEADETGEEVA